MKLIKLTSTPSIDFFTPDQQFSDEQMKAHSISKLITSRTSNPNVPEVLIECRYPELQEPQTLF